MLSAMVIGTKELAAAENTLAAGRVHPALGAADHILDSPRGRRPLNPLPALPVVFDQPIDKEGDEEQGQELTHRIADSAPKKPGLPGKRSLSRCGSRLDPQPYPIVR